MKKHHFSRSPEDHFTCICGVSQFSDIHKNPNAVALGRIGGSKKTRAKITASRKNGKLGGRPKSVPKGIIKAV